MISRDPGIANYPGSLSKAVQPLSSWKPIHFGSLLNTGADASTSFDVPKYVEYLVQWNDITMEYAIGSYPMMGVTLVPNNHPGFNPMWYGTVADRGLYTADPAAQSFSGPGPLNMAFVSGDFGGPQPWWYSGARGWARFTNHEYANDPGMFVEYSSFNDVDTSTCTGVFDYQNNVGFSTDVIEPITSFHAVCRFSQTVVTNGSVTIYGRNI